MEWFSVLQAAKILGLSVESLYGLCKDKLIPHSRIGPKKGLIRISQAQIDAYLKSCEVDVRTGMEQVFPPPARRGRPRKPIAVPADCYPDGTPLVFFKRKPEQR
ncbi:helix-turn-helix domain-containing protein [Singulisphaera sp. PoT]|uniref:helix-turn-helix domain-containing protein n=1 Tax=Singulisphaera sp. PoT TaxID=3411797 RepID=UPI003BF50451